MSRMYTIPLYEDLCTGALKSFALEVFYQTQGRLHPNLRRTIQQILSQGLGPGTEPSVEQGGAGADSEADTDAPALLLGDEAPQQRHLSQGCQRVCLALTARHHDCAFRASAHRDRAPAWPAHPSCRLSGGTPGAGQGLGTWSPQPSCTAGLERPAHATPSCLNTDCQALPLGRWRPPHRALHLPGAWAMLSPQRASCPRTPHPTPGDGSLGWPPAEDADMPSMWGARDTE